MMERLGTGPTAAIGTLVVLVFTVPYAMIGSGTSYVLICLVMLLQGFGIGISIMPAMTAAYRALRPEQISDATPQQNILMRVGASVGTAVLIAILGVGLRRAGGSVPEQARAFATTFGWLLAITAVAVIAATFLTVLERRHAHASAPVETDSGHEAAEPVTTPGE